MGSESNTLHTDVCIAECQHNDFAASDAMQRRFTYIATDCCLFGAWQLRKSVTIAFDFENCDFHRILSTDERKSRRNVEILIAFCDVINQGKT